MRRVWRSGLSVRPGPAVSAVPSRPAQDAPLGTMVKPRYKGRSTINPSRASTNPGTCGGRSGPGRAVAGRAGPDAVLSPQIASGAREETTCGTEPPSGASTCTGRRSGGERGSARGRRRGPVTGAAGRRRLRAPARAEALAGFPRGRAPAGRGGERAPVTALSVTLLGCGLRDRPEPCGAVGAEQQRGLRCPCTFSRGEGRCP